MRNLKLLLTAPIWLTLMFIGRVYGYIWVHMRAGYEAQVESTINTATELIKEKLKQEAK